ncbi:MAG: hypothetical protein IJ723_03610 [Ruminococcus sp.]|nr:hypothetical protein [Ruminococcus sp.]
MANNGYLRTVRMGGFDKQDVLAYVDDLNSKIYNLENKVKDLEETNAGLKKQVEEGGTVVVNDGNFEGREELEKKVEEAKNKVAELMASTDSMNMRIADYEQQISEKDATIAQQNEEIEDLKEQLEKAKTEAANAGSGTAQAFDMSEIFVQAQNSANMIVSKAKEQAKTTTDEAEAQAEQIIE